MAQKVSIVSLGGDWALIRPELTRLTRVNLETHALMRARKRAGIGLTIFAALFFVLGARLADLTIFSPPPLGEQALSTGPVFDRPDIFDRNGRVLATQIASGVLEWRVTSKTPADIDRIIDQLHPILPDVHWDHMREKAARSKIVKVSVGLSPEQQYRILDLGNPDLLIRAFDARVYPNGYTAAHVLGFVGDDQHGLAGLERYIDDLSDWSAPVETTIDVRVQAIMRDALAQSIDRFSAKSGVAMMMDVRNGEMIGLVSLPDFNPNIPMAQGQAAHFNHATYGQYELGSVFKIFTVAMALDRNLAHIDDQFDTTEPLVFGEHSISDLHGQKRPLTPKEILVHSSNIGSGKLALLADADEQARFWTDIGFYDRIYLEIPERGQPRMPERLGEVQRVTASYGHGIAVSPLHVLIAGAAMINGGKLVQPSLLPVKEPLTRQVISPETSQIIRDMLRAVVVEGTGKNADVAGVGVIGKTGSANKPEKGGYAEDRKITSFFGAFPYRDPRYALYVMLDEPQGTEGTAGFNLAGWNAAPLAQEIITKTAPLLGVLPERQATTVLQMVSQAGVASAPSQGGAHAAP